jgi:fucose permease
MMRRNPTLFLLISYFAFVAIGLPLGVLNIAWTYMQTTFGVSLDSIGILLGFATTGRLITSFISGRVMSRIGIGTFLLLGSSLAAVGLLGYAIAPSWEMLLVGATLASTGSGALDATLNTFVSAKYSATRLNWLHAAFGVGLMIGPQLVTLLVIRMEAAWQWSYLIITIPQLILIVVFLITRRQWQLNTETAAADGQSSASIQETLHLPIVWLSVALFIIYGGIEIGAGQLTNPLFTESRGIAAETSSAWISFYWLALTLGRIFIGTIADRVGNILLLRICMFGMIAGTILLAIRGVPILNFAGLAVIGFACAPMFPMLTAETPRRVGMRHVANAIGFQIGFAGIGAALLTGLGGALAENIGLEVIGPYLVVIAVATTVLHEIIVARETRAVPVTVGTK